MFPRGWDGKESACNAEDLGEGNGYLLQYSWLETEEPGGLQSLGHKESDTTEGLTIFSFLYFLRQTVYQGTRNIFASHQIWAAEVGRDIAMIIESVRF